LRSAREYACVFLFTCIDDVEAVRDGREVVLGWRRWVTDRNRRAEQSRAEQSRGWITLLDY
jgi:hypothetical protein